MVAELAYNNLLRTGATTDSVIGALTYTFGDWYIQPTAVPTFDLSASGRTPPPAVGGRARISNVTHCPMWPLLCRALCGACQQVQQVNIRRHELCPADQRK